MIKQKEAKEKMVGARISPFSCSLVLKPEAEINSTAMVLSV
jgi:hypothetical protein